jgi:hypothetical protein
LRKHHKQRPLSTARQPYPRKQIAMLHKESIKEAQVAFNNTVIALQDSCILAINPTNA